MTTEPLLVVHGVGNRSEQAFNETTSFLQHRLMNRHRLIHVFWGDLGGVGENLETTLPNIFAGAAEAAMLTRAIGEDVPHIEADAAAEIIFKRVSGQAIGDEAVRGSSADDGLQQIIAEAVSETQYLATVGDAEVLTAVGDLIIAGTADVDDVGYGVRTEVAVRAESGGRVRAIILSADAMIGKITSTLGGTLNQVLRKKMAVPISLTFGDVVAYHQNRKAIHERLFKRLDEEAPGCGTQDKPINVMAHSLGGLLILDAALAAEGRQLWINRLVTFGSQPAFFHVMSPRNGLASYELGKPVSLPSSIRHWTNLWHRLDVLAFLAKPVFRLHDGSAPVEVDVTSTASGIANMNGWLHGCYWNSSELLDAWS